MHRLSGLKQHILRRKITCLIVDDEHLSRRIVVEYFKKVPHFEVVGTCATALEALAEIGRRSVDVLMLDIELPDLNGLEMLKSLADPPLVIFTTAYAEYALQGYELDVVDYLLKPFRFERFIQALNKVANRLQLRANTNLPTTHSTDGHLFVRADHRTYKIYYSDLVYCQSMKEYVAFHLVNGKKILAIKSLRSLAEELPADRFMRIHRSYIVPLARITAANARTVQLGKMEIPIGGSYREQVRDRLFG